MEEEVEDGKAEPYAIGEDPPAICTPVFVVDKQGSLIGRKAGDYTLFNKVSENYIYPAPEADSVMMNACGKRIHTLIDCVWGFTVGSV